MITAPAFIAGLVAGAGVAWLVVWSLHRRRHRVLLSFTAVFAVLLSLAAVGNVVNAHYGYLPRFADVVGVSSWPTAKTADLPGADGSLGRERPTGAVVSLALPGRVSGFTSRPALVYLPPQYFSEPDRRFPVAYLLHGSPGINTDWFRSDRASDVGLASAQQGRPIILVAPQVSRRWSDDSECVDGASGRIETYFATDVVSGIDRSLRTIPTREARIVAGNSAGGYCALNLGLRHRSEFGTIIDMSGYTQPTYNKGMAGLFGHRPDLHQVVDASTPATYAPSLPSAPAMRIWFDVGRADRLPRAEITAIAPVLRARGEQVSLHLRPGGHVHQVWRAALRESIPWAAGPASSS